MCSIVPGVHEIHRDRSYYCPGSGKYKDDISVHLPEEGIQDTFNARLPHYPEDRYERAVNKDVPGQVGPNLFDAIFFLHATVAAVIPDLLFLVLPVGGHVVEVFSAVDRFLSQVCFQ